MSDIGSALSRIKGRWMIGGSALEAATEPWRVAVAQDDAPDVALLAIAGQASQLVLRPEPSAALQPMKTLPKLALPAMPDRLRPAFTRLLGHKDAGPEGLAQILAMIALRGYTVHPVDYMPPKSAFDLLPDIYGPWADWREANSEVQGEVLTAENWDNWYPAERCAALVDMRAHDPAAARAIVATCAADLPAEKRLRVIETFATGLSNDDADYLKSLAGDRSGKVQLLALKLLARLGLAEDEQETLAEYADFFAIGKRGLLRRDTQVNPVKLKTKAQGAKRHELSQKVSLSGFAKAMGLDPVALVAAWNAEDPDAMDELVSIVSATGSDATVAALAARVGETTALAPQNLSTIVDRLPTDVLEAAWPRVILTNDPTFDGLRIWSKGNLGGLPYNLLSKSKGLSSLLKLAQPPQEGERHRTDHQLGLGLFSLGLLADQNAAETLLEKFIQAGMFAADPALGLLTLNAYLTPGELP